MNPLNWFPGYKTYILAIGAILAAVGAWFTGDMALGETVEAVMGAAMAMTIRKGIKS